MFKRAVFKVGALVPLGVLPIVLVALWTSISVGSERTMKFENTTGAAANDLHIEFTNGSTQITDKGAFANDSENGNRHDLSGGSVANNGSTTIKAKVDGAVRIKAWWWTNNGVRQGIVHEDDVKALSVLGGGASGSGQISVSIGGVVHTFNTIAGHSPNQTVDEFSAFLNSFVIGPDTLISQDRLAASELNFYGNVLGDDPTRLQSSIVTPDLGQTLTIIQGAQADFVPALTTYGLIALTLLLLGTAVWAIRRRRAGIA